MRFTRASCTLVLILLGLLAAGCATTHRAKPAEPLTDDVEGMESGLETIDSVFDAVSIASGPTVLYLAACPTGLSQTGTAYIFEMSQSGGAAKVLNTTALWGSPAGLEVLGENLIVAVHPEPDGQLPAEARPMTGIYRISRKGGPAVPLWEGPPLVKPNRLAIVGSTIYVADMEGGASGSGAIFRLPVEGGRPEVVAQGHPLEDPVGLAASSKGLFIADRGLTETGSTHRNPGDPGLLLFLPFGSHEPEVVARGGLLKNPLDLELVGDTLYIADEGEDERSRQGVFRLSVQDWRSGIDLTDSIQSVYQGEPFVEPIALTSVNGKLFVADDTKSQSFVIGLPAPAQMSTPSAPAGNPQ